MHAPDAANTISTLTDLIETLKDGELGYQQAAQEAQDGDLKALCLKYSQQRHEFAKVLQKAAFNRGESKPETSSSASGSIHRGWIGLKAALSNQDRHAILAECERGEDVAKKVYSDALAGDDLDAAVQSVVREQETAILAAHDTVKKMRDAAKSVS